MDTLKKPQEMEQFKIKSDKGNNKYVMAAYLNLARQNMFRSLMHISKIMQIAENQDETTSTENYMLGLKIWQKLQEGNAVEQEKIIKLFVKHFPFLKVVFHAERAQKNPSIAVSPNQIRKLFLETIIPVLNKLRNEFTHFAPAPRERNNSETKLVGYITTALEGSAREVKNRFSPKGENLKRNPEQQNDETSDIKNIYRAIQYIFEGDFKYDLVPKLDENNNQEVDKYGKPKTVRKTKSDYFYHIGAYIGNNKVLTDIGIVLFACFFLEKRYIAMMLDKLKPWPQTFDKTDRKAVYEVFSVYSIRLPRESYDSTRPDYALGLDMLNELQKCPKELFDILSVEHRDTLSVKITAENADEIDDDGVTVKDGKVQMKRIRDRFAQMALLYVDRRNMFEDLRFMVHLGNYRYKFFNQTTITEQSAESLKRYHKDINGFGRLDEIEKERKKLYSKLFKGKTKQENKNNWKKEENMVVEELQADSVDSTPYITDTKARYLIHNNRIGLRFMPTDKTVYLPSLTELKEVEENGTKKNKTVAKTEHITLHKPNAWMSIFELPALVFYDYLLQQFPKASENGFKTAESIIKSYIIAYNTLFKDINSDKFEKWDNVRYNPLKETDLPEKIQDYIKSPDTTVSGKLEERLKKRLVEMINSTQQEVDAFSKKLNKMADEKQNKLNKKGYVNIKHGYIAAKLAKDIMFFAPSSDEKKKFTAHNFNSLQSALALSKITLSDLKNIMDSLKHPFSNKVFQYFLNNVRKLTKNDSMELKSCEMNLFHFYKTYLVSRLKYLNLCLADLKKDQPDTNKSTFIKTKNLKWQPRDKKYIMELAARYLNDGFELPRGMFTSHIEALLKQFMNIPAPAEERTWSTTNLINFYFTEHLKDDNQEFYNWPRHYDVFDKIEGKMVNGNQLAHQFLTPKELIEKMKNRKKLLTSNIDGNKYLLTQAKNSLNNNRAKNEDDPIKIKDRANEILKQDFNKYSENEKLLRRFEVQDKIMFLMAKHLLILKIEEIESETLEQFKLKDILPGKKDTILELEVPFTVTLQIKNVSLTITQEEKIKIKRYGEFFRFNNDTRLQSLVRYLKQETGGADTIMVSVDREKLERELTNYDLQRVEVMNLVHKLEKQILNKAKGKNEEVPIEARQNFRTLITDFGKIGAGPGHILIKIRNGFCHNEYAKEIKISGETSLPEVANKIKELFEETQNNALPQKG